MKKIIFASLAVLLLTACHTEPKFNIKGEISDADGKMLYFESLGLEGVVSLDSAKLGSDGNFSFKSIRPESPEFYRLRINDKVINLSIDSTETVSVKSSLKGFSTNYSVDGSINCLKIKELTLKQLQTQNLINALSKTVQNGTISNDAYDNKVSDLLKKFKDDVKYNYIFAHPNTVYAYYALFMKINNYLVFDPLNNKDDVRCFGAVATSLNIAYPHAERSKNLYNIVIKGMKNTRHETKIIKIPTNKINTTGVIEIGLRDLRGNIQRLTSLKGKVVLLDFTIYQNAFAAPHNLKLRDLYNKYSSKGFQIYQVSLDADEHFWKTSADNLPWICVRDENGIYSTIASIYNVKKLPAFFLINRNNELSSRGDKIKNLDAAIKGLL